MESNSPSMMIGIDLGTTNSAVAVVDAGFPIVLANRHGSRLTPSVVHYPADGEPSVGAEAARMRTLHPERTIYSAKRFMGKRLQDLSEQERMVDYKIIGQAGEAVQVKGPMGALSPESVSAEILKSLKATAERALECTIDRAVITVPAYFNDAQRQATMEAGRLAGFQVERIINEPTAAALAYGLNRLRDQSRIAVYDLGGGTFDITILELNEGIFRVLSTHGNTCLGGNDLDQAILECLLDRARQQGLDIQPSNDKNLLPRLREAAEAAKIRLSNETSTRIEIPFLTAESHFATDLTREELEDLCRPILQRTRSHCLRALADAKLEATDLDQVVLVGGQTRMPLVRDLVKTYFQCSDFEEDRGGVRLGDSFHSGEGPQLHLGQHPDEAVALGAAIQAAMLEGRMDRMVLLDVTPLSLGIETFGGLMNVLIPRNSTIPIKAGEVFTTAVGQQAEMLIHVLQGEREKAADNWSLGRFTIQFEKAPKGVPRVGVQFEIDANGILHVLARDIRSGKEQTVEIRSAIDVDDTKVTEMVESSVEHAFDDLQARRWIESKLKATELLKAVEVSLEDCGDLLSPEDRKHLDQALARLTGVLEREDTSSGTGDLEGLKQAMTDLDAASQELARIQMDKLTEEMFSTASDETT